MNPPVGGHNEFNPPRILIAGVGNVLRRDDGFGVETAHRLQTGDALPDSVTVIEVGIGGMSLVQELFDRYDILIVLDAVRRERPPGTVYVLETETPSLESMGEDARRDFFADIHYAEPSRALALAQALGALPPRVWIVGCEPEDADDLGIGLSSAVSDGVVCAVAEVRRLVAGILTGHAPVSPV